MAPGSIKPINRRYKGVIKIKVIICSLLASLLAFSGSYCTWPPAYALEPGKGEAAAVSNSAGVSSETAVSPAYDAAKPRLVYAANQKVIVEGYYASWAAYDGYGPEDIPADKLDVIAYAFAAIDGGFNVVMGDPEIDSENFGGFRELKNEHPGLKVIISIGGWTGSGRFSDAALSAANRSAFADSAIAFMKEYGFDGIDIDWEYPTGGGKDSNKARPEDKAGFTMLMAKLREALDG